MKLANRLFVIIQTLGLQGIFVLLFIVMLWLPFLQAKTNLFHYQLLDEKRQKAAFPELNKRSIIDGSFANGVENYWADHFGFRDFLIKVNNTINLKVFNKAPTQEIILGKDNCFF